jgi:hypothetical protein
MKAHYSHEVWIRFRWHPCFLNIRTFEEVIKKFTYIPSVRCRLVFKIHDARISYKLFGSFSIDPWKNFTTSSFTFLSEPLFTSSSSYSVRNKSKACLGIKLKEVVGSNLPKHFITPHDPTYKALNLINSRNRSVITNKETDDGYNFFCLLGP